MKGMTRLLFTAVVILVLPSIGQTQSSHFASFPRNCTNVDRHVPSKYLQVTKGWPYKLLCSLLTLGDDMSPWFDVVYDVEYKEAESDTVIVCQVWSENGTLLMNKTATYNMLGRILDDGVGYEFDEFQDGSHTNFTMALYVPSVHICLSSNIQLALVPFQQKNCQEILLDPSLSRKAIEGNVETRILPPYSFYNWKFLVERGAKLNWERNCSNLPNGVSGAFVKENFALSIPSIAFDQAGFYDCSITYNGMKRYILTQPLCVQHKQVVNVKPLFTCKSSIIKKNLGKDVTFHCTGRLGEGRAPNINFHFQWRKKLSAGNFSESTRCQISTEATDERVSCYYYQNEKSRCYYHIASEEEQKVPSADFPFVFTIRNITEDDYQTYVFELITKSRGKPSANVSVVLEKDPNPRLLADAIIIGICLGVFCAVLVLVGVILYQWLPVKVYWKRCFGAYEYDDKKYGAYLCYNFSKDIDAFAQTDVKQSISVLREVLEDMGYSVYDERRDGFTQDGRAAHIQQAIKDSHRVVILLSLELIKDGWSMLSVQTGFNEMIESGSKLIFVLLPGMKEYLKQHQDGDSTCLVIKRAIKLNYAISWWNNKNFNKSRFKLEMEDAMPKLKSQSVSSMKTCSLGNNLDVEKHNYQRCISGETDTTEVDNPRYQNMLESVSEFHEEATRA